VLSMKMNVYHQLTLLCCCVVVSVHFKSLDAGDKKKELDSEFEQQRKAVIEAAVQQQTQSARTTVNSPAVKQVGQHSGSRNASDTAKLCHFSFFIQQFKYLHLLMNVNSPFNT